MIESLRLIMLTAVLMGTACSARAWCQDAPDAEETTDELFGHASSDDDTIEGDAETPAGYLGLVAGNVDPLGSGVQVLAVRLPSAAEAAGIRPGDYIRSISDLNIGDLSQMEQALTDRRVGEVLRIEVSRGGRPLTLAATLTQRQTGDQWINGRPLLGVRVESAPRSPGRPGGALVREIEPGSPADRGDFPLGAVIVALDDQPIGSAQDLIERISQSQPGQTVELTYFVGPTRLSTFLRLAADDVKPGAAPDDRRTSRRRPVVNPPTNHSREPDLILLDPGNDIDSLRDTVQRLEQHVDALRSQLEETTRLLREVKQQIAEKDLEEKRNGK